MDKKTQTFEEAMLRLEEIAQKLENGSVPLEESLKLYEEGAGLAAFCQTALRNAQQRITEINPEPEDK